jgi:SRSO17 transposase
MRGLLIRRNLADGDLAFFSTWCPAGTGIETLVKVDGHRWAEVVKVPPAGRWNTTGGD